MRKVPSQPVRLKIAAKNWVPGTPLESAKPAVHRKASLRLNQSESEQIILNSNCDLAHPEPHMDSSTIVVSTGKRRFLPSVRLPHFRPKSFRVQLKRGSVSSSKDVKFFFEPVTMQNQVHKPQLVPVPPPGAKSQNTSNSSLSSAADSHRRLVAASAMEQDPTQNTLSMLKVLIREVRLRRSRGAGQLLLQQRLARDLARKTARAHLVSIGVTGRRTGTVRVMPPAVLRSERSLICCCGDSGAQSARWVGGGGGGCGSKNKAGTDETGEERGAGTVTPVAKLTLTGMRGREEDGDSGEEERPGKDPTVIQSATSEQDGAAAVWSMTPQNLEEQERLFFESGCTLNPVFKYNRNKKCIGKVLKLFQRPEGGLLPLAVRILETFILAHGSETRYLETFGGEVLTQDQTTEVFQKYVADLDLGDRIKLRFSRNTISPTSISHDPRTGVSVVTMQLPVEYRRNRILGVLNHEIGTHFIRKYNDSLQPWTNARGQFKLKRYIATEEGLASLNQLFDVV